MKKSIELNPDGTFPWQKQPIVTSTMTFTASTTHDPDFIPDPPKKKTWKEFGKDLLGLLLTFALGIGLAQMLVWIVEGIIKLVKFLN